MTNQIVIADMDDYISLYIDDKLISSSSRYDYTLSKGIEIGQKYPNHEIICREVDLDWFDERGDMPDDIADVVFR